MPLLSPEQFSIVFDLAVKKRTECKSLRNGQALFSALYEIHPDIADEITDTIFDPFYNDKKIADFINKLLY